MSSILKDNVIMENETNPTIQSNENNTTNQ